MANVVTRRDRRRHRLERDHRVTQMLPLDKRSVHYRVSSGMGRAIGFTDWLYG
jgi:hypothetical protein